MSPERPFPKLSRPRLAAFVLTLASFTALIFWLVFRFNAPWLFPLVVIVPVVTVIAYWRTRRCPECRGALQFRRDYFPDSTRFRSLLDCPRCNITWNTGKFGDDDP